MYGFRIFSLPSSGFFSPFPHGTSSLSVTGEYLVLDHGRPRFPQDYKCPVVLRNALEPLSVSFTGVSPSLPELSNSIQLPTPVPYCTPYNPRRAFMLAIAIINARRVWTVPFSLALLGESQLISLPTGTKMFQFPALAFFRMTLRSGFPIQRSSDRSSFGSSPRLIAAILRLSSPTSAKASAVHP